MIAVVTGAASGLGAAAARRLAASGCRVVAVDLPSAAERGGELVSELGGGDAALFAGADVSDEAQVAAALDACESRFGAPSVLVQCAGIGDARRTLSKKGPHSLAAFEKVMRVNTFGTFNVLRLTAERMAARDADADGMRGVIVNTASIAAYDGQIGQAAYGEQRRATRPLLASVSFVSLWFALSHRFMFPVDGSHRERYTFTISLTRLAVPSASVGRFARSQPHRRAQSLG